MKTFQSSLKIKAILLNMSEAKLRRKARKRQLKINSQFKKRVYKDVFIHPCFYCKHVFLMTDLTIEHLVPRSYGGTNDDSNIALACAPCNQRKGKEAWLVKKTINAIKYQASF